MSPEAITRSALLDIIFENRNKDYGAYELRTAYRKRLLTGILVMFAFPLLLLLLVNFRPEKKISVDYLPLVTEVLTISPIEPPEKKVIEPVRTSTTTTAAAKYSEPIVTADNIADKVPTMDELENKVIATFDKKGTDDDHTIKPPPTPVTGTTNSPGIETSEPVKEEKVWEKSEIQPEFPGGIEGLRRFLSRHLREIETEPGKRVSVHIRFVVDAEGKVGNFVFTKTGGSEYEQEVLRVMKKMPAWKPGVQNGTKVAVYFTIPVTFETVSE